MYQWMVDKELAGRFIFDLGQALYEGGRPKIGRMMMELGYTTSDVESEGRVSSEVVKMRLSLDYPLVADSILEVVSSYLNMTTFLSASASNYTRIDLENVVDVYWPLPLMGWSGLSMQPVLREFMWRFDTNQFRRRDETSRRWLENSTTPLLPAGNPRREVHVHVGLLGGHMNAHPVGRAVLHRLIEISSKNRRSSDQEEEEEPRLIITLLVFPLVLSSVTRRISSGVDQVINLPADTHQAWRLLESLQLDIVLFPDWQPFPGALELPYHSDLT